MEDFGDKLVSDTKASGTRQGAPTVFDASWGEATRGASTEQRPANHSSGCTTAGPCRHTKEEAWSSAPPPRAQEAARPPCEAAVEPVGAKAMLRTRGCPASIAVQRGRRPLRPRLVRQNRRRQPGPTQGWDTPRIRPTTLRFADVLHHNVPRQQRTFAATTLALRAEWLWQAWITPQRRGFYRSPQAVRNVPVEPMKWNSGAAPQRRGLYNAPEAVHGSRCGRPLSEKRAPRPPARRLGPLRPRAVPSHRPTASVCARPNASYA